MKHIAVLASLVLAVALAPTVAHADAIIPDATSKPSYCTRPGGSGLIRCFCDQWLRYPLCKRWHWHRGDMDVSVSDKEEEVDDEEPTSVDSRARQLGMGARADADAGRDRSDRRKLVGRPVGRTVVYARSAP